MKSENSTLRHFDSLWCCYIQTKTREWFNEILFQASRQVNDKIWKRGGGGGGGVCVREDVVEKGEKNC